MLAIHTRYLGPTNFRDGRITATIHRDGKVIFRATLGYSHELDVPGNHLSAARKVLEKYNGQLVKDGFGDMTKAIVSELRAESADNKGYVFLAADPSGWRYALSEIRCATWDGRLVDR